MNSKTMKNSEKKTVEIEVTPIWEKYAKHCGMKPVECINEELNGLLECITEEMESQAQSEKADEAWAMIKPQLEYLINDKAIMPVLEQMRQDEPSWMHLIARALINSARYYQNSGHFLNIDKKTEEKVPAGVLQFAVPEEGC